MNTSNHPKFANPDHPILEVLSQRFSPYVYADRTVAEADLRSLFEAARWAASSYNEQPWRFILATKADPVQYQRVFSCLVEPNQAWAKAAPVLAIGCYMLNFSRNGKPNGCAAHDLGLAVGNLSAEATARGLAVHPMGGILPDRVKSEFKLPEGVTPLIGLAIGYAAAPSDIPENMQGQELSPRTRKPLGEIVFGGQWGVAADL
ncbi:MAG: nitroreductase family protein [Planctomycetaceae bacterium]|nr:nitroreductase family protein [Planctomycetaceae bacterium]